MRKSKFFLAAFSALYFSACAFAQSPIQTKKQRSDKVSAEIQIPADPNRVVAGVQVRDGKVDSRSSTAQEKKIPWSCEEDHSPHSYGSSVAGD